MQIITDMLNQEDEYFSCINYVKLKHKEHAFLDFEVSFKLCLYAWKKLSQDENVGLSLSNQQIRHFSD
jgi:hypothetical protein